MSFFFTPTQTADRTSRSRHYGRRHRSLWRRYCRGSACWRMRPCSARWSGFSDAAPFRMSRGKLWRRFFRSEGATEVCGEDIVGDPPAGECDRAARDGAGFQTRRRSGCRAGNCGGGSSDLKAPPKFVEKILSGIRLLENATVQRAMERVFRRGAVPDVAREIVAEVLPAVAVSSDVDRKSVVEGKSG